MDIQNNKITLTNDEIILFNSLMKNEDINFFLYFHSDIGSNKLLAIEDTKKGKNYLTDDRTAAKNLFNKFCGTDCNDISQCTIEGPITYAARCAVSKSITNEFPEDKVDKSRLLEILKTMIDPAQHEKLIKENEIKNTKKEKQVEKNKQENTIISEKNETENTQNADKKSKTTKNNKITLTDGEIRLFNSLMKDEKVTFHIYNDSNTGSSNHAILVKSNDKNLIGYQNYFSKEETKKIQSFFGKFRGNDWNQISKMTMVNGFFTTMPTCSVDKSITRALINGMENNVRMDDKRISKVQLFNLLKPMIDPAQHEELIKENEIKDVEEEKQVEKNKQENTIISEKNETENTQNADKKSDTTEDSKFLEDVTKFLKEKGEKNPKLKPIIDQILALLKKLFTTPNTQQTFTSSEGQNKQNNSKQA